jgi:predicted ATPase/DNA-binding CsgD family transcriptional regulator
VEPSRTLSALPAPLSRFIGRERELDAILLALQQSRLVSLTGPGGCGKTRLALEAAHAFTRAGGEHAWFVELAALLDPKLLPATVASAVELREYAEHSPLEMLLENLSRQSGLLILDNCEHLVEACARFAQTILAACPRIVMLATSREALSLSGEQIIQVPPLAFPDPDRLPASEELEQYDAIRLFLERARTGGASLAVTERNALALARICHQLDGMPLALELAAARTQILPLEDLAARLEQSFRLLTGGSRTALPRQQTLQATIAWSYGLLSEQERILFARLSVFAGSFSLSGAEAICASEELVREEILELLSRLISKSLVHVLNRESQARYRLMETVRQYASEKLAEAGEARELHRRHATFFLTFIQKAEPYLRSAERRAWLPRLEQEHDNLRAAMRRALEQGERELALQLMGHLAWFWYFRGHLSEARQWYETTLATLSDQQPTVGKATSFFGAGALAWVQGEYTLARIRLGESARLWRALGDTGKLSYALTLLGLVTALNGDYEQALSFQQESIELFRTVEDRWGLALALYWLGDTWRLQHQNEKAITFYQESREHFRATGDRWGVALALQGLGAVAYRQQNDALASVHLEECLALRRQEGDQWLIAQTLVTLGHVIHRQGDSSRAQALFEEGMAVYRPLGDLRGSATALQQLATLALEQDAYEQAASYLQECLLISQKQGHRRSLARCLRGLAQVAAAQGDQLQATRLLGAAERLHVEGDPSPAQPSWKAYLPLLAGTDSLLDEQAIQAAWEEGASLTVEQALDYALANSSAQSAKPSSARPAELREDRPVARSQESPEHLPASATLSKRELEVLRLIVEGKSNRAIAQVLGITEKTVINHVTAIFNKTGCANRAAATAFALRHGLV